MIPKAPSLTSGPGFCIDSAPRGWLSSTSAAGKPPLLATGFRLKPCRESSRASTWTDFPPRRQISEDPNGFRVEPGSFVVGVVSRIRDSRRLDISLKAVHALAGRFPQLKLLLVGRGREGAVETVVKTPSREMGILDRIVLAGYCDGDRLVAAYRAMDVLVYASPGSDKSCRTVREAMAAGIPVIAPNTGFLPELIDDHATGRLMALSWQSLADILEELIADEAKLRDMGRRALETASRRFSPLLQAERTLDLYRILLERLKK